MIWKLCKMDFRGSYRTYCNMYLILFIASAIMQVTSTLQGDLFNTASSLAAIIFVATLMTLSFFFFINMLISFYQTMFGKQAYLTHTIPANAVQLLMSKLLMGVFWIFVSLLMIGMSLLFGLILFSIKEGTVDLLEAFQVLLREFGYMITTLEFYKEILFAFIGLSNSILFFYLIITLVNTCYIRNHRVMKGILIGFVSLFALSFLQNALELSLEASYLFSTILAIGFFLMSCYLLEHKMEIE